MTQYLKHIEHDKVEERRPINSSRDKEHKLRRDLTINTQHLKMLIFFDIVTFRTQSKKIIREGRNIYKYTYCSTFIIKTVKT